MSGKILVPMAAYDEASGLIGDGIVSIGPGHPDYQDWVDYYKANPSAVIQEGSSSSGNYGHAGIPGHQGGSAASGDASTNSLIEKVPWLLRDIERPYGVGTVALANKEYQDELGKEFIDFFEQNPYGETDKYEWEVRKVDQLRNLKIWKKKIVKEFSLLPLIQKSLNVLEALIVEIAEGGQGSGNFGHAGRPGEVGGSSAGGSGSDKSSGSYGRGGNVYLDAYGNPVQGHGFHDRVNKRVNKTSDSFRITDASELPKNDYGQIMVKTDGDTPGQIYAIKAMIGYTPPEIIKDGDPKGSSSDYLLINKTTQSNGKDVLNANVRMDEIPKVQKALSYLVKRGLPELTYVRLYTLKGTIINTVGDFISTGKAREATTKGHHPLQEFSIGQDLEEIKDEYQSTLGEILQDYAASDRPLTSFRNRYYRAVNDAFTTSFYAGWADGMGGEVKQSDLDWIAERVKRELGFVETLFQDLKGMRKDEVDSTSWMNARAEGYTRTLDGIYSESKLRANLDMPLIFGGPDGMESCETCQAMKGQTYPARWWIENKMIPGPGQGFENYECKGFNCQHLLFDKDGKPFTVEQATELQWAILIEGGPGSGNFGHAGRPGLVGGSDTGGGSGARGGSSTRGSNRSVPTGSFSDKEKELIGPTDFESWPRDTELSGLLERSSYRADLKDEVVTMLSTISGRPYDEVNEEVATWARTSNDHNYISLSLQEAAAEYFGNGMSSWQTKNLEKLNGCRDLAERIVSEDPTSTSQEVRDLYKQYYDYWADEEEVPHPSDLVNSFSASQEYDFEKFIDTTYKATQDSLSKLGGYNSPDDMLTLYRGVGARSSAKFREGKEISYVGNALESWTTSPGVAYEFAAKGEGAILAVRVPRSRVFSTPVTGLGCAGEIEVVIIGGVMDNVLVAYKSKER